MTSKHKCELIQNSFSNLPKLMPNESEFTKLKRKIQKLFLVSLNHPELFTYIKSRTMVEKECKRQVKSSHFIIHPLSEFRKYWNIIIFLTLFVHQFLTAFSIGFFMDLTSSEVHALIVIDVITSLILSIEIIISFRTGYIVKETNEIILLPKAIAKKCVKDFILDTIISLPYALILNWINFEENNSAMDIVTIIFMIVLFVLSLYRFERFHSYFSSVPRMLNLSEKSIIILTVCLKSVYLWHWTSSIRKVILFHTSEESPYGLYHHDFRKSNEISKLHVRRYDFGDNLDYEENKKEMIKMYEAIYEEILSNYTLLNKYTRSMMVTLKLSLQSGYGNETSDSIINMLLTSFIMIIGWIYSRCVLFLISNIIIASRISKNKYQEIMNEIKVLGEDMGLSEQLKDKMKTYVERKFQGRYFNEEAINLYVQSTAACLKKEIMMHSCSHLVAKVSLFKDLPRQLLENIISCLKFEMYFPEEIIIEANALGDSMYFIAYGTAVVISTSGHQVQTLQDGSHFGEISLLIKGQRRTATIMALEMCEVYKLSQKDFRKVFEPHHDVMRKMEETAKDRIRKMYQYGHGIRRINDGSSS